MITESGAERFRRGGVKPVRRNAGGWLMQSVTKRSDMDLHMSIDFLHVPPLPTVLLAAGLGTRLTPVTEYLPKCLGAGKRQTSSGVLARHVPEPWASGCGQYPL